MPPVVYAKQKELLNFVNQYISKEGVSPTLAEMAQALGVSSLSTVHEHLQKLEARGLLKRYRGMVRGIELLDQKIAKTLNGIEIPLVGLIAAGQPIEAIENNDETINVSPDLAASSKRTFALQVRGDSMIEEGILDGDYVVVQQQDTAQNGDIVVALIDNTYATLKRFFKEKNRVRLEPANAKMEPIYAVNVAIQGRVTGVVRRYL